MKYVYYALLGLIALFAITTLVKYFSKSAPPGPDSMPWALSMFLAIGLLVLVGLSALMFYFKWHKVALVVIASPLLLMVLSTVVSGSVDVYAWFPSFNPAKPLKLVINNASNSPLHVKMDVRFPTIVSGDEQVYATLDYYIDPKSKKDVPLGSADTRLLAKKSSSVGVSVYMRELVKVSDKENIQVDIQPAKIYKNEKPEAFTNGVYTIDFDSLIARKGQDGVIVN